MTTTTQKDMTRFADLLPAEQERIRNWARKRSREGWTNAGIRWVSEKARGVCVGREAIGRWVNEDLRRRHARLVSRRYKTNHKARQLQKRRVLESRKRRRGRDPVFRMLTNVRRNMALMVSGRMKPCHTIEAIGCSAAELMTHLERQFKPGMSRENYGEWHVDHKRPLASFDLSDPEQFKTAWHYTNLQPLWAAENLAKGATWN